MTSLDTLEYIRDFVKEQDACPEKDISARPWDVCHARDSFSWASSPATIRVEEIAIVGSVAHALPPGLEHIIGAIESSRNILNLEYDWDGDGSPGYTRSVWERAEQFLMLQARWAQETLGIVIDAPRILPAADGTIDLHWKTDSYELLLNIPMEPDEPAHFYGDNKYGNMPIKGTCDVSKPDRKLISWFSLFK